MSTTDQSSRQWTGIRELERDSRAASARFVAVHGETLEHYRALLSECIDDAKARLREDVAEISGNNDLCARLIDQTDEYIGWLQWSLWDLPYYAVAIGIDDRKFRHRVSACAMVYLAGRVFDDVIDRHFWYKAKRPTLLTLAAENHKSSDGAESLTILAGLLLCSEGLLHLADPKDEDFQLLLKRVLTSFRRTVVGAIMEQDSSANWSADEYERLIHLKNVDFWRLLYSSLDPGRTSPLYPFLVRYYAIAQKLNDVQDYPEDIRRGQPNLLSVFAARKSGSRNGSPAGYALTPAAEEHLAQKFLRSGSQARELPETERDVALLKLGESIRAAGNLGLFIATENAEAAQNPGAESSATTGSVHPKEIRWCSDLADVVLHGGQAALEEVNCPVCGERQRTGLFEKHGFRYHRCSDCTHVYVSPRVSGDLQFAIAQHHESDDENNDFLEVQRIFAEPICHLLRLRSRGTRLLDIGFGRGYVLKQARAYGFETYGVDSSGALTQALEPVFGWNVCQAIVGVDDIPWGSFDVVVMTHVAEHLGDPVSAMKRIYGRLNPGGLLYVAVPDVDSLQFKIFGKNWDAISPLAHLQYFNNESLSRLLTDSGFERLERIRYPALPRNLTPKWMQLMRRLGGDESGELALVARRPVNEDLLILARAKAEAEAAAKKGAGT